MHPERDFGDRPITRQERTILALALCTITAVAAACSACSPPGPVVQRALRAVTPRVAPATRTAAEQAMGIALVSIVCPDEDSPTGVSPYEGTALVVNAHHLVTAAHMARCATPLGTYTNPVSITVTLGRADVEPSVATVVALLGDLDVAQLAIVDDFSENASPISMGPRPTVGDIACEAAAWPRWTYRCNMVEPGPSDGPIMLDMKVEHGNSGSPLYVAGRLVGIITATLTCQDGTYCAARAAPLQGLEWLVQ